jgi:hypothetical protein
MGETSRLYLLIVSLLSTHGELDHQLTEEHGSCYGTIEFQREKLCKTSDAEIKAP